MVIAQRLGLVTLLVDAYDPAIAWFVDALGFTLREDSLLSAEKRWVVVGPPGGGCGLLLARAASEKQAAGIGQQGGGRVFLFLETDDFLADHARLVAQGVRFLEEPRREDYGTIAVFEDPWGNRWDLIGPDRADG